MANLPTQNVSCTLTLQNPHLRRRRRRWLRSWLWLHRRVCRLLQLWFGGRRLLRLRLLRLLRLRLLRLLRAHQVLRDLGHRPHVKSGGPWHGKMQVSHLKGAHQAVSSNWGLWSLISGNRDWVDGGQVTGVGKTEEIYFAVVLFRVNKATGALHNLRVLEFVPGVLENCSSQWSVQEISSHLLQIHVQLLVAGRTPPQKKLLTFCGSSRTPAHSTKRILSLKSKDHRCRVRGEMIK